MGSPQGYLYAIKIKQGVSVRYILLFVLVIEFIEVTYK